MITLKEINRLAIPAILAGIAEPLIGLVDTAIIGQLGTNSLSAVGVAASFFSLIIWVLAQTKSAISAIVSRYFGQQKTEELQSLIPQAIFINILLGVVFTVFTLIFSVEIFHYIYGISDGLDSIVAKWQNIQGLNLPLNYHEFFAYNIQDSVLVHANEYFSIRAFGFALTLGTFGIFGVFRGLQNTLWAMKISLIGGLVNIVFDLLFVYGIEGVIPSMGVAGAAYASLLAQATMFVLAIVYLLKKTPYRLKLVIKIHPELKRLMAMSGNLYIRTIALNVAYFLGNYFSNSYGTDKLAAHTIAMQIWLFSAFFIDGYANAGNAISGKLLGEKNFSALRKLSFDLSKLSLIVSFALSGVYLALYVFIGEFFSNDPAVVVVFNSIFWMVILSQPLNAIAFTFDGIFKGLGETAYLRNTLFFGTLLGFVPVIFLCDFLGLGLYSVWIAFVVWMIVRGGSLIVKFRRKYYPLAKD